MLKCQYPSDEAFTHHSSPCLSSFLKISRYSDCIAPFYASPHALAVVHRSSPCILFMLFHMYHQQGSENVSVLEISKLVHSSPNRLHLCQHRSTSIQIEASTYCFNQFALDKKGDPIFIFPSTNKSLHILHDYSLLLSGLHAEPENCCLLPEQTPWFWKDKTKLKWGSRSCHYSFQCFPDWLSYFPHPSHGIDCPTKPEACRLV